MAEEIEALARIIQPEAFTGHPAVWEYIRRDALRAAERIIAAGYSLRAATVEECAKVVESCRLVPARTTREMADNNLLQGAAILIRALLVQPPAGEGREGDG